MASGLSTVQTNIAARITETERETGRAHLRIDGHDQRIARIEQANIDARLAQLESTMANLQRSTASTSQSVMAHATDIANIRTSVAAEVDARDNADLDYDRAPDRTVLLLH
eukprot:4983845-Karenia_brevis.AAC.1